MYGSHFCISSCFTISLLLLTEALINLGLENRAIAPTLMNATSSRSHTVLTLNLEQRVSTDVQATNNNNNTNTNLNTSLNTTNNNNTTNPRKQAQYTKTLRSKLLMVDLAGSERVRRTVSKGARLSEAKSINTSLSALGNVIAALAEVNVSHIPYRRQRKDCFDRHSRTCCYQLR